MTANDAIRLPAGPRIWSTEVAGGRMHVIADGRAVVAPTRADLKQGRGGGMSQEEIKIGSTVQTGVYVMHEWKPMCTGRVVQMSSDRSVAHVDIGSPCGAAPWIAFERTDHLRLVA